MFTKKKHTSQYLVNIKINKFKQVDDIVIMETLSFEVSNDILRAIRQHPEIKWEDIARKAIEDYVKKLNVLNELLKNSDLSEIDAEEISELIKESAWKKLTAK